MAGHSLAAALSKKGTPASVGTDTGAGTARLAPPCMATDTVSFFRPRPTANGPGSTLIWRQTSVRGPGPQRQVERKQVSAWLCPPFSVCAVPTLSGQRVAVPGQPSRQAHARQCRKDASEEKKPCKRLGPDGQPNKRGPQVNDAHADEGV